MNVLICDDNAKEREWCHKELLKNQGYFEEGLKVLEYESGNELLFKYPDLDIDIDIIFFKESLNIFRIFTASMNI